MIPESQVASFPCAGYQSGVRTMLVGYNKFYNSAAVYMYTRNRTHSGVRRRMSAARAERQFMPEYISFPKMNTSVKKKYVHKREEREEDRVREDAKNEA